MKLCIVIVMYCVAAFSQSLQTGDYLGTLQMGVTSLRLALHLKTMPDGSWSGTLDSLDQGAFGLPIKDLKFEAGTIRFTNYEGKANSDGSEIAGKWLQNGASLPLVFKKVSKIEAPRRPQEPKRPFPYNEEELEFESKAAGIHLAGTLTTPKSGSPFAAAILLSGSGPQDRDSTLFGHKPFLLIADYLTRKGFAILRLDDRGVGRSTGSSVANSTLEDLAQDAVSAAEFLRKRKEIDPKRIGFIGHSEGGLVAPLAADKAKAAFVILMAGSGVPGAELLYEQGQAVLKAVGAAPNVLERQRQIQHLLLESIIAERDPVKLTARLREDIAKYKTTLSPLELSLTPNFDQQMEGEIRRLSMPELQSFVRHDPGAVLKTLLCPLLAMIGTLDTQVPAKQNLPAITAALAHGLSEDYSVVGLPKLNHLFQTAKTGAIGEYLSIEETVAPLAVETMAAWLEVRFPRAAATAPPAR